MNIDRQIDGRTSRRYEMYSSSEYALVDRRKYVPLYKKKRK
jgi:hypothetical protein